LHIVDPAQDRTIHIAAGGSNTAVVWNPWEQLSRTMADLGDDDYRRLVCVETANAADEVITIDTDGEYALSASYRATTGD
jgi:glucose-6-phosphate 1-epimerase